MSRFYTAEKVTISSLEDMTRRPNFEPSVSPRKSQFRYVVAAYSFPRKIASCGVSDCYQNHKKGYLIHLADGGESSICESCANRFMDASALKPPRATRQRSTAPQASGGGSSTTRSAPAPKVLVRQMSLELFNQESSAIKERVKTLKTMPQGANWVFQSISQFQKLYPRELLDALRQLKGNREESPVFEQLIEQNASDQQLQDIEQLQGLGVLDKDMRQLLIEDVLKPLTVLEQKAAKATPDGTVAVPIEWADQVEANLLAAEKLIEEAQLFFEEKNFERLVSIPLPEEAAKKLRNLRWNFEKGGLK